MAFKSTKKVSNWCSCFLLLFHICCLFKYCYDTAGLDEAFTIQPFFYLLIEIMDLFGACKERESPYCVKRIVLKNPLIVKRSHSMT